MAPETELADLVRKHHWSAKLVRAYCRARGWRHGAQGAPGEWYAAWSEISRALENVLDQDSAGH